MSDSNVARPFDFSFLDNAEFRAKYTSGASNSQIRFYVAGIKCAKCVRKLEDLPLTVKGLKQVRVELGKNLAHAEVDTEMLSFSSLAEKIAELGFKPIPLSPEMKDETLRKAEDRTELIRLAVAGACAGNIMTFSFATYLGIDKALFPVFAWLSFFLYLPVVTFVAKPFYLGAWNSLRQRSLSIDLPMAVASLSGFIFSTAQLARGREDIYFDSLSGFLFLILVSRWAQKRLQRKFLRPQELIESLQLERVRRVHESGWAWAPIDQLQPGERILLCAPETLPAEAELVSGSAHFSMAWLSGESKPQTLLRGATVPAGARLVHGEAQLIARNPLSETGFGQILHEVQNFSLSNNRIVSLADRWAQWLLAIVFATALTFLLAYWNIDSEEAIRRSLALIILACPCAMAFGTPLALASALKKAQAVGLIIRSANVFEKVQEVDEIFFDKTGTLTETDLELRGPVKDVAQVYQKVVLSLENESMHPIAFAFRKAFEAPASLPPVDGYREIPGLGVSGYIFGKFYELKRNTKTSSDIGCTLFEDHIPILTFAFEARLKPDCASVLNDLRARGLRVKLLSGDKREVVEKLGKQLGFAPEDCFAEVDPRRKLMIVSESPRAMMIGDGLNDSLAMMKALVGVAASGGMEAALRCSDVYLAGPSLKTVKTLFEISSESLTLIRRNLVISLIYNSVGGALALLGFINPFTAAVLMPVSSGFILLSTWIKTKSK